MASQHQPLQQAFLQTQGTFETPPSISELDYFRLQEELYRTKAELEGYRSLYSHIVTVAPTLICSLAPDGTTTFLNRAVTQVTGYLPEEILGKNWWQVMYPGDAYRQVEQLIQDFEQGQVVNYEMTLTTKSNHQRVISWNSANRWNERGELIEVIGIGIDITERKQAEAALQVGKASSRLALPTAELALEPTGRADMEIVLHQQVKREQLVGAITQRIRQSLNLEVILSTTVTEVQQFLQVDRVLLYRIWPNGTGSAVTESVSSDWPAILGRNFPAEVFPVESQQQYLRGRILAIADVEQAEILPCLVEFVQQFGVRAKLVVPILQETTLWGLLVAHHCRSPRQWQISEIELLKQLATQAGIALQQSELYQQVQRLNTDLEQQVQERTAQLQRALELEATLKRITDKVRDNLDESQILQAAVQELGQSLGVLNCDAGIYSADQTTLTIAYEYTTSTHSVQGQVLQLQEHPQIHMELRQGQHRQFCFIVPHPFRPICKQAAVLACPIVDDQGAIGDMWLFKPREEYFDDLETRLVQQVANQCAIAIRQARLYQTAQAQVVELERLNHLKDDFLSTVSHELRTPISNIKMAIHMLQIAPTEERRQQYLHILETECRRESELINDLLDLQRLEADHYFLSFESIILQDWLPEIVEPFLSRAQSCQQRLHVEQLSAPATFVSDPNTLSRILSELLNNACKYTSATGEIILRVERSQIFSSQPEVRSGITFVVSNQAEIPAEELPLIFDKFYRVPHIDPWRQGGTGLGLALVQKLVEQLQGSIQAKSGGGWTTFTIEL